MLVTATTCPIQGGGGGAVTVTHGETVVLVTAMESHEHRARGLEVGADAYIGKSSFDQQTLLDTIQQLLG